MKKLNVYLALAFIALFSISCSKDDEGPAAKLTVGEEVFSLKGSKVYLAASGPWYENHKRRTYCITDGEIMVGQDGYDLTDYTDATYFVVVDLAIPNDEEFAPGDFPQDYYWEINADAKAGYIEMETENEDYIVTPSSNTEHSPIKIKGGFDDGETITFSFEGKLEYSRPDGTDEGLTTVEDSKLSFQGKIIDKRPK